MSVVEQIKARLLLQQAAQQRDSQSSGRGFDAIVGAGRDAGQLGARIEQLRQQQAGMDFDKLTEQNRRKDLLAELKRKQLAASQQAALDAQDAAKKQARTQAEAMAVNFSTREAEGGPPVSDEERVAISSVATQAGMTEEEVDALLTTKFSGARDKRATFDQKRGSANKRNVETARQVAQALAEKMVANGIDEETAQKEAVDRAAKTLEVDPEVLSIFMERGEREAEEAIEKTAQTKDRGKKLKIDVYQAEVKAGQAGNMSAGAAGKRAEMVQALSSSRRLTKHIREGIAKGDYNHANIAKFQDALADLELPNSANVSFNAGVGTPLFSISAGKGSGGEDLGALAQRELNLAWNELSDSEQEAVRLFFTGSRQTMKALESGVATDQDWNFHVVNNIKLFANPELTAKSMQHVVEQQGEAFSINMEQQQGYNVSDLGNEIYRSLKSGNTGDFTLTAEELRGSMGGRAPNAGDRVKQHELGQTKTKLGLGTRSMSSFIDETTRAGEKAAERISPVSPDAIFHGIGDGIKDMDEAVIDFVKKATGTDNVSQGKVKRSSNAIKRMKAASAEATKHPKGSKKWSEAKAEHDAARKTLIGAGLFDTKQADDISSGRKLRYQRKGSTPFQ